MIRSGRCESRSCMRTAFKPDERAQIESLVMSGVQILVEYAAGVVKGTIGAEGATGATGA